MRRVLSMAAAVLTAFSLHAQNPYLPLWEFIPDGEPYVFEDPDNPGKYRLYVYGSHDNEVTEYCGRDQVVWSAPVDNLADWRCDGVIFQSLTDADGNQLNPRTGKGDILYAPDIAAVRQDDGSMLYYLYPNNQSAGRQSQVCVSSRPDGPFEVCNWNAHNPRRTDGVLGFDPAVFVDDDGRVYGYWGFEESFGAELDPETMATVKPGTEIVRNMVSDYRHDGKFRFFEASSMRKIKDKYVFIYSRYTEDGCDGLPRSNNTLAYAYSDNPLGPFKYGGTIVDAREPRENEHTGMPMATANPFGNTHGSIINVKGQWWIFYHRQTGTDQFSRQAMVAPINVKVEKGPNGKVEISRAEVTSEGFCIGGLNPMDTIPAGLACWFFHPVKDVESYPNFKYGGSYIQTTHPGKGADVGNLPVKYGCSVVNNTAGSIVGFKYLNFNKLKKKNVNLEIRVRPHGIGGRIIVMAGDPTTKDGALEIAEFSLGSKASAETVTLTAVCANKLKGIIGHGKKALFFKFQDAPNGESMCDFYDFRFY